MTRIADHGEPPLRPPGRDSEAGLAIDGPLVKPRCVALVGNRNVGKSTIFNALTGLRQKEANYPGVTVERREGVVRLPDGSEAVVLDLPGTNSLVARSPDEEIVSRVLLGRIEGMEAPDVVVVVLDATQLRRGLFLVSQVLECGLPVVLCLNMVDDARQEGLAIDAPALSRALGGVPVVETVASKKTGIAVLEEILASGVRMPAPEAAPGHPEIVALPEPSSERWRILRQAAAEPCLAEAELQIRWNWVDGILARLGRARLEARRVRSDRIDRVLLHPVTGPLVFMLVMGLLFQAVFSFAGPLMETIDGAFGDLAGLVREWIPAGVFQSFVADGVIAGVGAVLVFLPQILILFFFLGLLEDSGYLTRAAFIVDAPLRKVGLSGRSFIPLLSSFACAVPGIMATRSIEDRRERLLTIMVAPLMTCSARLPVYTILIGTFIPARQVAGFLNLQGVVLFSLYMGGMVLAALAALVMDRFLGKGRSPGIMELAPYRLPRPSLLLQRLRHRTSAFLRRAGTIILAMSILIWALISFPSIERAPGMDAQTHAAAQLSQSFGGSVGHAIEPMIAPLGFDWRIGIGLVSSLAAREVFVSTMAVVYSVEESDESGLRRAMTGARHDETGLPVYDLPTVLALLAFYMVALQCMSTLAVVRRETGSWWFPAMQFVWMTALAWCTAFLVRMVATAAFSW